jgi:exosortase O
MGKNVKIQIQQAIPLINLLILSLWLGLFRYTFSATFRKFSIDMTFFGKVVFIFILAAFIYRFIKTCAYKRFMTLPAMRPVMMTLLTLAAVFHLYNIHFINMNIISVITFIIGTYLLLSLYFPSDWRKNSIIPLLLIISALPLSYYAEMTVGFPLRVWSADAVTEFLKMFNIHTVTREAVILIESRATKIDLSCSGMKGLWAGSLFYFGAGWINNSRINIKYIAGYFSILALILTANLVRITVLTVTYTVLGNEKLADFIHEPLGVAGFILACVTAYLLFLLPDKKEKIPAETKPEKTGFAPSAYMIVLFSACLLLYSPKKSDIARVAETDLAIKGGISTQPLEFTKWEKTVFGYEDTPLAKKYRFSYRGMTGSVLLIQSRSWRSQHNPLFCLQGMGLKVDNYRPLVISQDFTTLLCSLDNRTRQASFWFQDRMGATDDYSKRIWSGLTGKGDAWVMVSILFDKPYSADNAEFIDFHKIMFDNIERVF